METKKDIAKACIVKAGKAGKLPPLLDNMHI
jgi:hypothetical protein